MQRRNKIRAWLLNVTLFVILSPILWLVVCTSEVGLLAVTKVFLSRGNVISVLGGVIAAQWLILVAAVAWILLKGRAVIGLALVLCSAGLLLVGSDINSADPASRQYVLAIGERHYPSGIDVYCNGILLGKTPLAISEEEFRQRVKPVDSPPKQERVVLNDNISPGEHISHYLFDDLSYVPYDIFEVMKTWPPDYSKYQASAPQEVLNTFLSSKYWWHFELNGCAGLSRIQSLSPGGGGGRVMRISLYPQATYPSLPEHLERVIEDLRRDGYKPSDEWVRHFLDFKEMLFVPFYWRSRDEAEFGATLEAILRNEFGIEQEEITEEKASQVLDQVLERVEETEIFSVPSLESAVLDLVGDKASKAVAIRYTEMLGRNSSSSWWGESSGGEFNASETSYMEGRAVRRLPLEYAIRKIHPPELYNRLVYELSGDVRFLSMVANYPRAESERLARNYLNMRDGDPGRLDWRTSSRDLDSELLKISNPKIVKDLLGAYFQKADPELAYRFITHCLDEKATDQNWLMSFIEFHPSLNPNQRSKTVARLKSPSFSALVTGLCASGKIQREDIIAALDERPNPLLAEFLIGCDEYYRSKQGPGYYLSNLRRAMLRCDSPEMQQHLRDLWNKNEEERSELLRTIAKLDQGEKSVAWLPELIGQIQDSSLRLSGVSALAVIDNDPSWGVLDQWAADPSEEVRSAAEKAKAISAEHRKKTDDLIDGRIKPDDLLDPAKPYVWDGTNYVPATN